jgi:hypothetical protein
VSDDGKTLQVRLTGDELTVLQVLADSEHEGSLSAAVRSLIVTTDDPAMVDDGDTITFRFSTKGAEYVRDLAKRRGGASLHADPDTTPEDTIRRALHLGFCAIERAVEARGPKFAGTVDMHTGRRLGVVESV